MSPPADADVFLSSLQQRVQILEQELAGVPRSVELGPAARGGAVNRDMRKQSRAAPDFGTAEPARRPGASCAATPSDLRRHEIAGPMFKALR